jgi:CRP/FNR family transcriptional regulator
MENIEVLKKIPFFNGLPEPDLKKIAQIVSEKSYEKGSIIFGEGDPGRYLYFVERGKVKVFRTYEDGKEHIVHILGDGDIFGEASLFNDIDYPASASSYEDSSIGTIRNSDIEKLIRENPELSLRLIKLMSRKLVFAQQKIRDLTFNDVFSRTASQIFKLSGDYGKKSNRGIIVDVPVTRQELADMVGTTRETVSRVISRLKKDESIDEENDRLLIINEGRLRSWI